MALSLAGCSSVQNVRYSLGENQHQALVCLPETGSPPFPTVIFHHGMVVDLHGLSGAAERGYSLESFCHALAGDGYLAFLPIREGLEPPARQLEFVLGAHGYVKRMRDVDPSSIAMMGFSRGALLTLMAAQFGLRVNAFSLLAPAPGPTNELLRLSSNVDRIRAPVQNLVALGDDPTILEGSEWLAQSLRRSGMAVDDRRYSRSNTDCRPGPGPTCAHRLFYTVGPYWSAVRAFLDKYVKSSEGFTFRFGSDS